MNDGWLCDSILKAHAHPSPMSMIPAFSPGPCTTSLLRVGSRFRCTREDLYEQCSLHITLKMPSSVRVGSRPPSSCLIFSYSSGVRPCSRIISGVTAGIAEVVITGKLYCRTLGEFLHAGVGFQGKKSNCSRALVVRAPGRAQRLAQAIHILSQRRICDVPGGSCAYPNLAFARKNDCQPASLASRDDRVLKQRALGGVNHRVRPKNCSQIVWDNRRAGKNPADINPDATRTQFLHRVFDGKACSCLRCLHPAFHEFGCLRQRHLRRRVINETWNRAIRWQQFEAPPKKHLNFRGTA